MKKTSSRKGIKAFFSGPGLDQLQDPDHKIFSTRTLFGKPIFWVILIGIMLLIIPLFKAMPACLDIQSPGVACRIVTPVITCSTYDLYNSSLDLVTDDGGMSQIGTSGLYNFTLNLSAPGGHKILLCDNTTATIEVSNTSNRDIITIIETVTSADGSWVTNIVHKVWAHLVQYINPSSSSLNASDTLKTIAENTEAGGY